MSTLHVTQRERALDPRSLLVTAMDRQGRFTYANAAYLEATGYTWEELAGKPTSMASHPDMPPEASADMAATLGRGAPWTGLVKARCRNGDHFWTRANFTPTFVAGKQVGSLMVRRRATPEEVAAIEPLYRRMRERRDHGLRFVNGQVLRGGAVGRLAALLRPRLRARIWTAFAAMDLAAVAAIAAAEPGPLSMRAGLLAAGVVALSAIAGAALVRSIAAPMRRAVGIANRVAGGDLEVAVPAHRRDEIGDVMRALAQMSVNMRATVLDVRTGLASMQGASAEIAAGSSDLAARAETQASSLQETAASMEELTGTVRQNADAAGEANSVAAAASRVAAKGGEMVGQVVSTMEGIARSSRKIAEIIGVIDGIAFQTNILALNAAVEAARAGEQGRGFAVVAGEVRTLAQRSAQAAREIKQLISQSSHEVHGGSKLVGAAGQTMDEIVEQVRRVSELIGRISGATLEQSAGLAQVNQAVAQIDRMTQQTTSLVERSASAAQALSAQAEVLSRAVGLFRIEA